MKIDFLAARKSIFIHRDSPLLQDSVFRNDFLTMQVVKKVQDCPGLRRMHGVEFCTLAPRRAIRTPGDQAAAPESTGQHPL